jgi:hypothetical protein
LHVFNGSRVARLFLLQYVIDFRFAALVALKKVSATSRCLSVISHLLQNKVSDYILCEDTQETV